VELHLLQFVCVCMPAMPDTAQAWPSLTDLPALACADEVVWATGKGQQHQLFALSAAPRPSSSTGQRGPGSLGDVSASAELLTGPPTSAAPSSSSSAAAAAAAPGPRLAAQPSTGTAAAAGSITRGTSCSYHLASAGGSSQAVQQLLAAVTRCCHRPQQQQPTAALAGLRLKFNFGKHLFYGAQGSPQLPAQLSVAETMVSCTRARLGCALWHELYACSVKSQGHAPGACMHDSCRCSMHVACYT
jgi:hypothetical protein